jgi:hypothetical protein
VAAEEGRPPWVNPLAVPTEGCGHRTLLLLLLLLPTSPPLAPAAADAARAGITSEGAGRANG